LPIAPCFPLETILAAVNRSRVDYLSLDVEGVELQVLKTIDWSRLDISVLSVEFVLGQVGIRNFSFDQSINQSMNNKIC